MQLSKALPATGRLAALTRPPMLITAISVEPPPMSTTMQPCGWRICSPAPSAAATGSSTRKTCLAPAAMTDSTTASASMPVMAAGTQTAMRGLKKRERQTSLTNRTISSFVMRWSCIMPSRSGRTRSIWAGARPTIFRAASPTAMMELVRVSTAPMVGWRKTTPCSSVAMMIEVVPRSIPMSYCFMDRSP